MKWTRRLVLLLGCMGFGARAFASDIVNGFSAQATIVSITSNYTNTVIKLASVTSGCGSPDSWVLPLEPTESSRYKRAAITGAFLAGKSVILRCENSVVSDFQIFS